MILWLKNLLEVVYDLMTKVEKGINLDRKSGSGLYKQINQKTKKQIN
jgi:hypothetical protein